MNTPIASATAGAQTFHEPEHKQFAPKALGLGALWSKLLHERMRILTIATVFAAIAALYATLVPPQYVASARILVEAAGPQQANGSSPSAGDPSAVESHVQIIASDDVLHSVVKSENLALDPEFGVHVDVLSMVFGSGEKSKMSPEQRAFHRLSGAVDVQRVADSYVVEVSVSTKNPRKSARIAQAVAATYVNAEFEAKAAQAGKTASSLTRRLEELQAQLKAAEGLVETYKSDNRLADPAGRLVSDRQLSQLSAELVSARARAAQARTKYEQIERLQKSGSSLDAVGDAIQSEIITQLRVRQASLRVRQVAQEAVLHPDNPELQQMRDQAASLRRQIDIELERIANASKSEAVRLQTNVLELEAELQKRTGDSVRTNKSMVRLRELERDVEAKKVMYQTLLEKTRALGEADTGETANVRIVTPARAPSAPNGLPVPMMALLGFGAGLLVGSAYVFTWSPAPILPAASPAMAAAPVASQPPPPAPGHEHPEAPGAIAQRMHAYQPPSGPAAPAPTPPAPSAPVSFEAPPAAPLGVAGVSLPPLATVSGLTDPTGLYPFVTSEPLSLATAAVGQLNRMLNTTRRRGVPQTVVIGSCGDVEARPGIAMNLALCAASGGDRVLLIDADFAGRLLSSTLAGTAVVGLGEVAAGIVAPGDVMIKHPSLTVAFVPAVENRRGSQHLLSEAALRDQVLGAVSGFELIVIDAGQMLHNPSTLALAAVAHDIVMVTDHHHGHPIDLPHVLERLGLNQTKVRGTLLVA